ncbi:peptidoglycan bridge formation glycyltransferase FemA/FemB family protein [Patescibacteria group bacterium]|nr:peptidoglycan bridge formation glycyltransferase FemA/FemB family protein [Patescibacteria group bacterium]
MEIQQSPYYADFIRSLGWVVETIDGGNIFIKPFPIIGGLAKIQRVTTLPSVKKLLPVLNKHRVRTVAIEPDRQVSQKALTSWCRQIPRYIKINKDPYIPTKTIRVDLAANEQDIFHRFSEAKRRAVRRAEKYGVTVSVSDDITTFLRLKSTSAGFLGFITTSGVHKLWQVLPKQHKSILLARDENQQVIGGILLLFWDRIAYYWIAGALMKGKKMFAPTLLVWEALKESKKKKCVALDFVGVWDERKPDSNHEWKGFTKFKEGFGGYELYYPLTT